MGLRQYVGRAVRYVTWMELLEGNPQCAGQAVPGTVPLYIDGSPEDLQQCAGQGVPGTVPCIDGSPEDLQQCAGQALPVTVPVRMNYQFQM